MAKPNPDLATVQWDPKLGRYVAGTDPARAHYDLRGQRRRARLASAAYGLAGGLLLLWLLFSLAQLLPALLVYGDQPPSLRTAELFPWRWTAQSLFLLTCGVWLTARSAEVQR